MVDVKQINKLKWFGDKSANGETTRGDFPLDQHHLPIQLWIITFYRVESF